MANITLSADARLISEARKVAKKRGTTLNELVRGFLRELTGHGRDDLAKAGRELIEMMQKSPGHLGGRRFRREDAYEGRL